MYEGDAKQEAPGILAEIEKNLGIQSEETECWPENWDAFEIFSSMSTQWNVGIKGAIGLRYESLPVLFEAFGIETKSRAEMIQSLRIMENEALHVINGQ